MVTDTAPPLGAAGVSWDGLVCTAWHAKSQGSRRRERASWRSDAAWAAMKWMDGGMGVDGLAEADGNGGWMDGWRNGWSAGFAL